VLEGLGPGALAGVIMQGDMEIVAPLIEEYLGRIYPKTDQVEEEMRAYAAERGAFPIVGPLVGRLLEWVARSIGAKRVLEVGSGFGYSAYWFSRAVGPGGQVVLTEYDKGNADRARDFLGRAGFGERVEIHVGDGVELASQIPGPFDVAFFDLDKERYPLALSKTLPLVRKGGLLIADNVLWGGAVAKDVHDQHTEGLREYIRKAMGDPNLYSMIVPLRDGVAVSLKLT
jgi:caffeoyl-CoA O-methyltransferase